MKLNINFWAGIGLIGAMLMREKHLSDWVLIVGSIIAIGNIILSIKK